MAIVPSTPDTRQQLSYLPPDFINLSLPNARFSSPQWIRLNGTRRMTILAGDGVNPDGSNQFVPYGKYARAALLFLCTEAVRTSNPVILISETYRGFMKQIGVSWKRDNAIDAARQMQSLAASTISIKNTVNRDDGKIEVTTTRYLISSKDSMIFADRSGELSEEDPSSIVLSPDFMQMLSSGSRVPIRTDVWLHLLHTSRAAMTLDIYLWLAYRLHHINTPVRISWEQLRQQFGSDTELKDFTRKFRKALAEALRVYPEAQVSEFGAGARGSTHGIMLKISKNAIDSAWTTP